MPPASPARGDTLRRNRLRSRSAFWEASSSSAILEHAAGFLPGETQTKRPRRPIDLRAERSLQLRTRNRAATALAEPVTALEISLNKPEV